MPTSKGIQRFARVAGAVTITGAVPQATGGFGKMALSVILGEGTKHFIVDKGDSEGRTIVSVVEFLNFADGLAEVLTGGKGVYA